MSDTPGSIEPNKVYGEIDAAYEAQRREGFTNEISRELGAALLPWCIQAVKHACLATSLSHEDRKDVVAKTLFNIAKGIGKYNPYSPFHSWAYGVLRHVILDMLRANKSQTERFVSVVTPSDEDQGEAEKLDALGVCSVEPGPDIATIIGDDYDRLSEAIDNHLTSRQRQAVCLYYIQGLTLKETAERMGYKSPKGAFVLIEAALPILRKNYRR